MWNKVQGRSAAPPQADESLETRVLSVRADTVNEEERSIEAVLASDSPVELYSWRDGPIDEVLLIDGAKLPARMPLLAMHNRFSLDYVLGSVRDIKTETANGGANTIVGRLYFAEGDEDAERTWNKVRQGHLTDVSIGYRRGENSTIKIEPGQSAKVRGRTFEAKQRALHVVSKWNLREASIVPIGADQIAKTRDDNPSQGAVTMTPKLREYLTSIGMRADASEADAWQYLAGLQGDQLAQAQRLVVNYPDAGDDHRHDSDGGNADGDPAEGSRGEPDSNGDSTDGGSDDAEARGVQRERQRLAMIRRLAGDDVPQDIVGRAIDEGWDEATASSRFLASIRTQRMYQEGQTPAGQSTDHGSRVTTRSLAAGLMISSGMDPVNQRVHDGRAATRSERLTEQDADYGDELSRLSAVDLVRECARLDNGGRLFRDPTEAFRAALSGTSLDRVFTTNVYAQLVAGWEEVPDTTSWCQVEDVPNFMQQEDITLRANSQLDRHPRGATAKHATAEDDYETYKAYRFSKQFVADEQDILDDRLGALMQMPREMGQAARRVRPDLVYSILLANGTLTATSGALFNATAETTSGGHANLGSTSLGSAGLKSAIEGMMGHRLNPDNEKVPLNIRPAYLMVPPDLEFTARELLSSAELRDTSTNTTYMTINVLRDVGLTLVVDSRLDAVGVTDPVTGTAYTGSASNYFLAAARRTVKVLYRRGTGRSPQLRSFNLTQGQWGLGWDINLDTGAAAVDYRGLYQGNS